MAKTIFEEMGGTYVRQGDYLLPCLSLPAEKGNKPVGVWGQRHLRYLRHHRKALFTELQITGKLNGYLADLNEQADDRLACIISQMQAVEGITEELKARDQLAWVGAMNSIRSRAEEIIRSEMIYV